MAKTVRLDSLRSQVRQRASMENSQFVTDSELTGYINASIGEFDDLLWAADASSNRSRTTINVVANTDTYTLPSDFRSLLGVEYQQSTSPPRWATIRRCPFEERNRYWEPLRLPPAAIPATVPFRYYLEGAGSSMKIVFTPLPTAAGVVQVIYRPVYTTLSADGDTLDGVNGLEEYVVVDCAIKCLQKEDSDTAALMAQKAALLQRVLAAAKDRDANEPSKVSDVGMIGGYSGTGQEWF